jgi:hypothetical protein
MAARVVAADLGESVAAVILAAYATELARISGVDPVVIQGVVANRFRPGLADASHPLCQNGIFAVEVGDAPFAEIVARAQRASLQASKYAYFDPKDHAELLARVARERGEPVDIGCLFNVRDQSGGPMGADPPPTPADIDAARDRSVLRWDPPLKVFPDVMITFEDAAGAAVLVVEADTHVVSAERMAELVWGMEEAVVAAAAGRTRETFAGS